MGIATHLGVLLDHPTIGCAKSRLCGQHDDPGPDKGDWAPIYDGEEVIGAAVRSRAGVKPIYVSIGHRVDLETAIETVLSCCTRYKLPETTRWAHRVAGGAALP
jgi:deoxyribonuclease V